METKKKLDKDILLQHKQNLFVLMDIRLMILSKAVHQLQKWRDLSDLELGQQYFIV
ncbi:hypothetical protein [Flavobacterium sp. W22_SRS_FK3]|uniref:hypothetical protein n=1 Tax=Flavobacterium sp. W22_SRS_FK3 TaxID=3240275 RepID=UPI003F9050F3